MFDPRTKLYLPVFFSLMTSRTQDSYKRLLHCIELAVGSKPDINTLVCDFACSELSYHRELNTRFKVPHPTLVKFVERVQDIAQSYVVQWKSVISKDADAPTREPIQLP
ncbi:Hypothetical protein PHPALM_20446 [Phytophthora palmivora]|uniref:MULE transposase domain-containing protein n=1 Tax=Phytophthora palmivora TaxID=4796 RepID=A0A2P4XEV7_9STRA|nr:Hypothetical protein PHPALM_20446 [Phytophthora palmivora]